MKSSFNSNNDLLEFLVDLRKKQTEDVKFLSARKLRCLRASINILESGSFEENCASNPFYKLATLLDSLWLKSGYKIFNCLAPKNKNSLDFTTSLITGMTCYLHIPLRHSELIPIKICPNSFVLFLVQSFNYIMMHLALKILNYTVLIGLNQAVGILPPQYFTHFVQYEMLDQRIRSTTFVLGNFKNDLLRQHLTINKKLLLPFHEYFNPNINENYLWEQFYEKNILVEFDDTVLEPEYNEQNLLGVNVSILTLNKKVYDKLKTHRKTILIVAICVFPVDSTVKRLFFLGLSIRDLKKQFNEKNINNFRKKLNNLKLFKNSKKQTTTSSPTNSTSDIKETKSRNYKFARMTRSPIRD